MIIYVIKVGALVPGQAVGGRGQEREENFQMPIKRQEMARGYVDDSMSIKILDYLREHPDNAYSLKELAETFNISESDLYLICARIDHLISYNFVEATSGQFNLHIAAKLVPKK